MPGVGVLLHLKIVRSPRISNSLAIELRASPWRELEFKKMGWEMVSVPATF